jgi:hypothetical protein
LQQQTVNPTNRAPKTEGNFGSPTVFVKHPDRHLTYGLPKGTQKAMIDAAKLADREGTPINRLLTIRTSGMRLSGDGGILRDNDAAGSVIDFLNRHTRWCTWRGIPVVGIWVREFCHHHQEHFHLGYHMPAQHDADYAAQCALWLDEKVGPRTENPATVVTSELGSWQIDGCVKSGSSGHHIAAYLGKAEPNDYLTAWGKTKRNHMKQRRRCKGGEGRIEGTSKHHYRWGTSLAVGRTQRDRNGFYSN